MHIYNLTLQKPGAVNAAVFGSFSAPRRQEIIVSRGRVLELLRPEETGRLQTIASVNTFALIRALQVFRIYGTDRDYLIVASDSGRIAVVEFSDERNAFVPIHLETYGKTGCRRITPGQYLAADPHGRAVMISAVEKGKLVYVLSRSPAEKLVISSPLEAHKSQAIVFDVVGLDTGLENPIFAVLEMDYSEVDADPTGEAAANAVKLLSYYELDLGLNNVSRKWSRETDRTANQLVSLPGLKNDGPSGVLILCENWVIYEHNNQDPVRAPIPRRTDMPERGLMIIASAVHRHKGGHYVLLQSELGDLYKVTVAHDPGSGTVTDMAVQYFDTIPPAAALCITRNGLLFSASEFGNHFLYQFTGTGEADSNPVIARAIKLDETASGKIEITCPVFNPRSLTNLLKIDELNSLAPVLDARVLMPTAAASAAAASGELITGAGVGLTTPQIITLCGRGPRSTLRLLREGLPVTELAKSPMPGNPMYVFTVKSAHAAIEQQAINPDKYIVISFTNATLVLAVGDTVEEVSSKETGFVDTVSTLAVTLLADDSYLQIHPGGMRHIKGTGAAKRIADWKPPGKRNIVKAACNNRQVLLALSGGDILYFELDEHNNLAEHDKKNLGTEIVALAIGPVPEGRLRAPFCALADVNNMVRVLTLDPTAVLTQVSSQALRAAAESLLITDIRVHEAVVTPHLFIGLSTGILTRVALDPATGLISDPRSRFLGVRAVKLATVAAAGGNACLALSSRPWLNYNYHGKFYTSPLSYDTLESGASFVSEMATEGIVAIAGNTLRIISIDRLGDAFNQKMLPLRYTPRKMALHPSTGYAVIVEGDHNAYNSAERREIAILTAGLEEAARGEESMDIEGETKKSEVPATAASANGGGVPGEAVAVTDPQAEGVDIRRVGGPLPGEPGKWASAIRVVDITAVSAVEEAAITNMTHPATQFLMELDDNEAAISVAMVTFHDHEGQVFCLVGTVKGMTFHPRAQQSASVDTYLCLETDLPVDAAGDEVPPGSAAAAGTRRVVRLQLLHRTPVEDIPYAIAPFLGRVLVGVGSTLRLYDLGKKKLLRKCEERGFPTLIHSIHTSMDRIFVADAVESIHFVKYKRSENVFVVFADDTNTRHMTAVLPLDHDTVAGGDKFGNVFIIRIPPDVSDDIDNPTGNRLLWDSAVLNGAPNKAQQISQFYVGEVVTSLQKAAMAGGQECIMYTTISGTVGALLPFISKDDIDFFTHLEIFLRNEAVSVVGRDHLSFRSFYIPVKDVIDGDLCESYASLPVARQRAIAGDLDRTPADVMKKLEDIRSRML